MRMATLIGCAALAVSAGTARLTAADDGNRLVEAWRLVSWETRLDDGTTRRNLDPAENGANVAESRLVWERVSR